MNVNFGSCFVNTITRYVTTIYVECANYAGCYYFLVGLIHFEKLH